jgi:hypothetical protein
MIKKKCKKCDKEIEGYSEKHVDYLMAQHDLAKHKKAE